MINTWKVHGGTLQQIRHVSKELGGLKATFSIYLPPNYDAAGSRAVPLLFFLSGLTCTDENFCQKSGAIQHAARTGIAFVAPDTSPRGAGVAGEDDSWDFGTGAGFYLDATQDPWAKHYRMYSYVYKKTNNNFFHSTLTFFFFLSLSSLFCFKLCGSRTSRIAQGEVRWVGHGKAVRVRPLDGRPRGADDRAEE